MKQKYKYLASTLVFLAANSFLNAGNLQTPVSSLNDSQMDTFILGKSFFRTPWVEAPSATTARDGLGPLFSANTCTGCHLVISGDTIDKVKKGKDIVTCPHCGRILYYRGE